MTELLTVLKSIIGQKLIGVTEHADGTVELHFPDWVIFVKDAYSSPIIERVPWSEVKSGSTVGA